MAKDKLPPPGIWEARLAVALVQYVSGEMPEKIEALRTLMKIARMADAYATLLKAQEAQADAQV